MNQAHVSPRTLLVTLLAAVALALTAWVVMAGAPGVAHHAAGNSWNAHTGTVAGNSWNSQPHLLAGNSWNVVQH